MKTKYLIYLFFLLVTLAAKAQVVEKEIADTTRSASTILDQASASFTGTSPQVTLKTYKLKALIGRGYWDLYLFNTLPTFTIAKEDSIQALSDDLLNQLGGLLNVSLSRVGHFGYGGNELNRDIKGGVMDIRTGVKMLDSRTREKNSKDFVVPVFQSTFDLRYLIPLVKPENSKNDQADLHNFSIGNLSFRVYGTFMQILNTEVYDQFFTSERGVPPRHSLFTGSGEVNLFISNQIFISAGYTISNQETMPSRSFFSISYTGQGN
jgi:hypothetical protein